VTIDKIKDLETLVTQDFFRKETLVFIRKVKRKLYHCNSIKNKIKVFFLVNPQQNKKSPFYLNKKQYNIFLTKK